jgi:hypothetical protein
VSGLPPIVIDFCGNPMTFREIAEEHETNYRTLVGRWRRLGSPSSVGMELVENQKHGRTVIYEGEELTMMQLGEKVGLSNVIVTHRLKRRGYPKHVTREMLQPASNPKALTIDGVYYKNWETAGEAFGLSYAQVRGVIRRIGKLVLTKEEFLAPPPQKKREKRIFNGIKVFFEDYGQLTFSQIADVLENEQQTEFYRSRWHREGRPEHITREAFAPIPRKVAYPEDGIPRVVRPARKRYLDPNYLPHITWNDLGHLSDTFPNTGAGRGEFDDEHISFRNSALGAMLALSTGKYWAGERGNIESERSAQ